MKISEILSEGKNHPIIVVDVQPEYSGIYDGSENPIFEDIINFVNNQTGPVLMFVNSEKDGYTNDTINDIKEYWNDTICPYVYDEETDDYVENTDCPKINWNRFTIVDKGYGWFRTWMDDGVSENVIIKVIRKLYQMKLHDARQLPKEIIRDLTGTEFRNWMFDKPFIIYWTSIAQLKKFNGAYIVGGGRNECLRELELLMNAFNIKYKRIEHLVYG